MAISVDWPTKVITVPKADTTLLDAGPPELRQLDIDFFRLALKALEDDEEGMPFLHTHNHNTEVVLSGLTYARIIEIVNGYTITFEDGQYTVSCTGANHNLADVKTVNQVSLIVNNAAGLITTPAIEFSSFEGGVHLDATSSVTGTDFPTGTPQRPVNNLSDALLIAVTRGFTALHIIGDFTFGATDNIDGYQIIGQSHTGTMITVVSGCSTDSSHFQNCMLVGDLDGNDMEMVDVHLGVGRVTGFAGHMRNCMFEGSLTLAGTKDVHLINCVSGIPGHDHPDVDMGGSGRGLGVRGFHGGLGIENLNQNEDVSLDFNSGHVHLHSSVTDGTFVIRGIAKLSDESTGTADVDSTNLINAILYDSLGIIGENVKWSAMVHDSNNNLTAATITQYTDNTLITIRKAWILAATYNTDSELITYELKEV